MCVSTFSNGITIRLDVCVTIEHEGLTSGDPAELPLLIALERFQRHEDYRYPRLILIVHKRWGLVYNALSEARLRYEYSIILLEHKLFDGSDLVRFAFDIEFLHEHARDKGLWGLLFVTR